ncbi:MAG: amidohydrolase family protein [Litoreibacter sp.]|nr:amidohydrolase family protein [Litoreibacter sp.]MCY4336621.1 amidohydrolase family protein [Litoreibacter sp.]
MRIDAHQHFWVVERGDYGWLTPDLTALYRDFAPSDLMPLLVDQGIDGTVLVQAAPTVAETHYMLQLADAHDEIKGVVGWVDFEAADGPDVIAELAQHPKLVGLRPMIQDIADDDWMLGAALTPAFQAMVQADLVFDALTLPRHLANLETLLVRHPDLSVVIDHGSKPEIAQNGFDRWAPAMARLAANTSAKVKLSGLVTEAGAEWTTEDLRPYVDHLLGTFGPARMIWGSDWPVCTQASSYARWCDTTELLLNSLTSDDTAAFMGRNAIDTYKLDISA